MNPDWIYGLLGGLPTGMASAVLLLVNGRVAGIVVGLLAQGGRADAGNRVMFLAGSIAGPAIAALPFAIPETAMFVAAMITGMAGHRIHAARSGEA